CGAFSWPLSFPPGYRSTPSRPGVRSATSSTGSGGVASPRTTPCGRRRCGSASTSGRGSARSDDEDRTEWDKVMIGAVAWLQLVRSARNGRGATLRRCWALLLAAELGLLLWGLAHPTNRAPSPLGPILGCLDFLCWQQVGGALLLGPV